MSNMSSFYSWRTNKPCIKKKGNALSLAKQRQVRRGLGVPAAEAALHPDAGFYSRQPQPPNTYTTGLLGLAKRGNELSGKR
jgi:hypothetical protein